MVRIASPDTHYHRVVFFNHDGEVSACSASWEPDRAIHLSGVRRPQDDKENLYVCEYGNFNDRAQKFKPDGTYISQIGAYGTEDGQFQRLAERPGLTVRIYIVDAFNNRIQVFDEAGKLVAILGTSDKIS